MVPGTVITLAFDQRGAHGVMTWRAGCNVIGGNVRITATRLLVSTLGGTAMGCDTPRERQDVWLIRFFGNDPHYAYRGKRLSVQVEDTEINFRRTG